MWLSQKASDILAGKSLLFFLHNRMDANVFSYFCTARIRLIHRIVI